MLTQNLSEKKVWLIFVSELKFKKSFCNKNPFLLKKLKNIAQ